LRPAQRGVFRLTPWRVRAHQGAASPARHDLRPEPMSAIISASVTPCVVMVELIDQPGSGFSRIRYPWRSYDSNWDWITERLASRNTRKTM
jgi:hypothetical protein